MLLKIQEMFYISGVPPEFSCGITPDTKVYSVFSLVLAFILQYDIHFPRCVFLN